MPATVYRLFDASGALLYVGVTTRGRWRMHEHAKAQPWWHEVATATFEHFDTVDAAYVAEARAIAVDAPLQNLLKAGRLVNSPYRPASSSRFAEVLAETATRRLGRQTTVVPVPDFGRDWWTLDELRAVMDFGEPRVAALMPGVYWVKHSRRAGDGEHRVDIVKFVRGYKGAIFVPGEVSV